MKKRLLVKLGLVALVGTALFVAWLWWTIPTSGINRATANRIRVGMSEVEVERMIGVEAGTYATKDAPFSSEWSKSDFERFKSITAAQPANTLSFSWEDDNGTIVVCIGRDDRRVVYSCYVAFSETIPDKLRRWLRLD
jgi:hypothetical protein